MATSFKDSFFGAEKKWREKERRKKKKNEK
jgi:hypothetical protein